MCSSVVQFTSFTKNLEQKCSGFFGIFLYAANVARGDAFRRRHCWAIAGTCCWMVAGGTTCIGICTNNCLICVALGRTLPWIDPCAWFWGGRVWNILVRLATLGEFWLVDASLFPRLGFGSKLNSCNLWAPGVNLEDLRCTLSGDELMFSSMWNCYKIF